MSFYTDKWMIVEKDEKNILLFRKSQNKVIIEKIVGNIEDNMKENLCEDILEEYDISIGPLGDIYFIYQNKEMNLILKIIKEDKIEEVKLTRQAIPEVYELNILVKDKKINIIYCMMSKESGKYIIYHHYYNGKVWDTFIPEEIEAKKILNPIRVISEKDHIILSYINMNKDIMIKKFNLKELKWGKSIKLIKTDREKLFLDVIKTIDNYYFTYCEYVNENLVVKYEKFLDTEGGLRKISEDTLSNEGTPAYPTIILYNNRLWIIWVELNRLFSRYYNNKDRIWSETYLWKETKNIDFLIYKYLSKKANNKVILNYSFGRVYPEVKFLGFGSIENTEVVSSKTFNIKGF